MSSCGCSCFWCKEKDHMRCFGEEKCSWNRAASNLLRISEQSGAMDSMVEYLVSKVIEDHDKRKRAVNPYMGATTVCDGCGQVITVQSTFLMHTPCRKKYLDTIRYLRTEGLVKYCDKCGRALALDANYCDRCKNPQYRCS